MCSSPPRAHSGVLDLDAPVPPRPILAALRMLKTMCAAHVDPMHSLPRRGSPQASLRRTPLPAGCESRQPAPLADDDDYVHSLVAVHCSRANLSEVPRNLPTNTNSLYAYVLCGQIFILPQISRTQSYYWPAAGFFWKSADPYHSVGYIPSVFLFQARRNI